MIPNAKPFLASNHSERRLNVGVIAKALPRPQPKPEVSTSNIACVRTRQRTILFNGKVTCLTVLEKAAPRADNTQIIAPARIVSPLWPGYLAPK